MTTQKKYKFNIADLPEKEIDYELEIRDMEISGTLEEKQKRLRPILRDERESALGFNLIRVTADEIEYCSERVAVIEQELINNPGNHYDLKASLIHCHLRIKRLKSDISNKDIIRNILKTCENTLAKYFPPKSRKNSGKQNSRNSSLDFEYSSGESSYEDCNTGFSSRHSKATLTSPQNFNIDSSQLKALNLAVEEKLKRLDQELATIEKFKRENNFYANTKTYTSRAEVTFQNAQSSQHNNQFQTNETPKNQENTDQNSQISRNASYNSQVNPQITQDSQNTRPNYSIIQKWNTKYSGTNGLELNEFRMRVECLARIDNVSEEFVLNGAFHLFEGDALFWYLQNQQGILSWEHLINSLSSRFVHTDNAFVMKIKAENRLQGKNEPAKNYLNEMARYFFAMGTNNSLSEAQKIEMIFRN